MSGDKHLLRSMTTATQGPLTQAEARTLSGLGDKGEGRLWEGSGGALLSARKAEARRHRF